jgi:hypothetical protein
MALTLTLCGRCAAGAGVTGADSPTSLASVASLAKADERAAGILAQHVERLSAAIAACDPLLLALARREPIVTAELRNAGGEHWVSVAAAWLEADRKTVRLERDAWDVLRRSIEVALAQYRALCVGQRSQPAERHLGHLQRLVRARLATLVCSTPDKRGSSVRDDLIVSHQVVPIGLCAPTSLSRVAGTEIGAPYLARARDYEADFAATVGRLRIDKQSGACVNYALRKFETAPARSLISNRQWAGIARASGPPGADGVEVCGVAVTRTGHLAMVDSEQRCIHIVSIDGAAYVRRIHVTNVGPEGYSHPYHRPMCIAVTADGLLVVGERSGRLVWFTELGEHVGDEHVDPALVLGTNGAQKPLCTIATLPGNGLLLGFLDRIVVRLGADPCRADGTGKDEGGAEGAAEGAGSAGTYRVLVAPTYGWQGGGWLTVLSRGAFMAGWRYPDPDSDCYAACVKAYSTTVRPADEMPTPAGAPVPNVEIMGYGGSECDILRLVYAVDTAMTPCGRLVTLHPFGTVRLWKGLDFPAVVGAAVGPATTGGLWSVGGGQTVFQCLGSLNLDGWGPRCMALSPDGRIILVDAAGGVLVV